MATKQYFGYDENNDDHDSQLHDWVNSTGCGVIDEEDPPSECIGFIESQFARFGIPYIKEIDEVCVVGGRAAFYTMGTLDPYCTMFGTSDVDFTSEWRENAYTVTFPWQEGQLHNGVVFPEEVNPGNLETYRFLPGADVERFNQMMSHPGLEALPNGTGHLIGDLLSGEFNCVDAVSAIEADTEMALMHLCRKPTGEVDYKRMLAYFELAAWATFVWFCGPYGRKFRYNNHEIFNVCAHEGECILSDGCVLAPQFYKKEARPPKSCFKCGIASWCVEPTLILDNAYNVCEHCTHDGMKAHPMATCGSKICILSECKHHPYHHMGGAGIHHAARQRGMLNQAGKASGVVPTLGQATKDEKKFLKS